MTPDIHFTGTQRERRGHGVLLDELLDKGAAGQTAPRGGGGLETERRQSELTDGHKTHPHATQESCTADRPV